jgi:hypothetical protein
LSLRPAPEGGVQIVLFNASEEAKRAAISPGLISFKAASLCDLFGNRINSLPVNDGVLEIVIAPRRTTTLRLED